MGIHRQAFEGIPNGSYGVRDSALSPPVIEIPRFCAAGALPLDPGTPPPATSSRYGACARFGPFPAPLRLALLGPTGFPWEPGAFADVHRLHTATQPLFLSLRASARWVTRPQGNDRF